ncbi:hypothetical protein ACFQ4K_21055 [Tistrella bauzanensis]
MKLKTIAAVITTLAIGFTAPAIAADAVTVGLPPPAYRSPSSTPRPASRPVPWSNWPRRSRPRPA